MQSDDNSSDDTYDILYTLYLYGVHIIFLGAVHNCLVHIFIWCRHYINLACTLYDQISMLYTFYPNHNYFLCAFYFLAY